MLKSIRIIVAFSVMFSGAAAAQAILTPEQIAACKPDFDKYCGGRIPGKERVIGCFQSGPPSDACKKAMEASDKERKQ